MDTDKAVSVDVPQSALLKYFQEATYALNSCRIDSPLRLAECRAKLLEQQQSCLHHIVQDYNDNSLDHQQSSGGALSTGTIHNARPLTAAQVQMALRQLATTSLTQLDDSVRNVMDACNDAARLSFARLALTSECWRMGITSLDSSSTTTAGPYLATLISAGSLSRSDVLEYCGLVNAAIRLTTVQQHLRDPQQPLVEGLVGIASTDTSTMSSSTSPMKRLEFLQRLLMQAMGYNADFGTMELTRQFQRPDQQEDAELLNQVVQTMANLKQCLVTLSTTNRNTTIIPSYLSDSDQGGVTRVVSVQLSEIIPQSTAPRGDTMEHQAEQQQQQHLAMAKQAAALHSALLQELNSLSESERSALLEQAEKVAQDFERQALQREPGPNRIAFLRSMDAKTQKLLAMNRVWQQQQHQQK